jgi:hypothetical protein
MTDTPQKDPRIVELETKITEIEACATQRIVQSELRSHALRAGMIDLDALKLIDAVPLTLTDKGEVAGIVQLMADLKRAKPYLFQSSTTSSLSQAPPSTPPAARRATDMTHEEWQTARALLLKR